jgi:hypothetical protein
MDSFSFGISNDSVVVYSQHRVYILRRGVVKDHYP